MHFSLEPWKELWLGIRSFILLLHLLFNLIKKIPAQKTLWVEQFIEILPFGFENTLLYESLHQKLELKNPKFSHDDESRILKNRPLKIIPDGNRMLILLGVTICGKLMDTKIGFTSAKKSQDDDI